MTTDKDNIELAYYAGFFDGEGSVAIYPHKYVVSLTNTDIRPLVRAKDLWGGAICCQLATDRKYAIRDLWRWQIYGVYSVMFLNDIYPFVKIKKEQIDVYLSVLGTAIRGKPTHRSEFETARFEAHRENISRAVVKLKLLKRSA